MTSFFITKKFVNYFFLHFDEMNFELRVTEAFGNRSVQEIAGAMEVNYSTLDNWLKLRREIPNVRLIQISALTGVSIHWLLTGRGPKFVDRPPSALNPEPTQSSITIGTMTGGNIGSIGGDQVSIGSHTSQPVGKITEKQVGYLKSLMDTLGRLLTEREGTNGFGLAMSGFKRKFRVAELNELPSKEMDEALIYLRKRIKQVEEDLRDEGLRK